MVVPLILNEPLAAPVPSVKLALACDMISMPPSLPLLEMLVVPLAFRRRACRKLLVSVADPSTISEESVRVTLSPLTE